MKVNGIHHIAIICSDYKRSKRFYTEVLGFKVIEEIYREHRNSYKLDLEIAGRYQIELFSFPNPPKRPSPEACGLRHVAFEVDNIYEVAAYLELQGVEVENIRVDEITGTKIEETSLPNVDGRAKKKIERSAGPASLWSKP